MNNKTRKGLLNSIEIQNLINTIPAEHQKTLAKIIDFHRTEGIQFAFELMKQVTAIPLEKFFEYGVWRNDEIDGG